MIITTWAEAAALLRAAGPIPAALRACRGHIATAAAFSLALNVLHLAAPLYMMQIYDRVIASGSFTTLAMLTLAVLLAFLALAGLDRARAQVLTAAGLRLERLLSGRVFAAMMHEAAESRDSQRHALRDLDACRQFICGHGMTAIFDLPWLPLYVAIGCLLHWTIGAFTLACAATLVGVAAVSDMRLRSLSKESHSRTSRMLSRADVALRNAHSVRAMSMMPGLLRYWERERASAAEMQHRLADRTSAITALVRLLRLSMQSLVLGLGATLFIQRSASAGAIFAGSLLLSRSLQPVEQIIGHWNGLMNARQAVTHLTSLFNRSTAPSGDAPAAAARRGAPLQLAAVDVSLRIPHRAQPILDKIDFVIDPGSCIGLIGPSGAGKSSLVRLMVGASRPTTGSIRLGGCDIGLWLDQGPASPIGYMSQEVELFDGDIAANIGRFGRVASADVVRAASIANVHEMILALPAGYRTNIGEAGLMLSGGMRQRIALARAVFGSPRLVVLDEPSSNLDKAGEMALAACIRFLKAQGTTIVLVSHQRNSVALMDKFIVVIGGRLAAYGTRQEVVERMSMSLSSGG